MTNTRGGAREGAGRPTRESLSWDLGHGYKLTRLDTFNFALTIDKETYYFPNLQSALLFAIKQPMKSSARLDAQAILRRMDELEKRLNGGKIDGNCC